MSFRDFIKKLDENKKLEHENKKYSKKYEISSKLKKSETPVLFEKIKESKIRVAGNVYGSRDRVAESLEIDKNNLLKKMKNALPYKNEPGIVSEGPAQEIIENQIDLKKLPILKHFEKDGGPYVTASIIVAKDSKGIRNLSFHRMQLIEDDKFTVRLVPRDLHKIFKEKENQNQDLEVAVVLGVDVGVALAAATSEKYERDEYSIANALTKNLELIKCRTVDLEVPATSEIVLEGKLLSGERAREGPFADITETYDAVREQPVLKVETITRREDTIYPAILPGSVEHQLLMGTPREPIIFEEVNRVAKAKNVALTPGGCGWLHAVVSIEKEDEKDAEKAIEAAFRGHSSVKHVVIVDEDIDVYNSREVEWAIATRFRADEDSLIKSGVKGSSLDPTADPDSRLGCKMGLDATKDLEDPEKFERAKIPEK